MFLVELFTTVYPIAVDRNTENNYEMKFWDPKTLTPVRFAADRMHDDRWYVQFSRGREIDVTGQGNQFKIFSTIIECIKKFIEAKHPEIIEFISDEESRSSLYNSMIKKYASSMGYSVDRTAGWGQWVLVRNASK
jgi:hypothetical protein